MPFNLHIGQNKLGKKLGLWVEAPNIFVPKQLGNFGRVSSGALAEQQNKNGPKTCLTLGVYLRQGRERGVGFRSGLKVPKNVAPKWRPPPSV